MKPSKSLPGFAKGIMLASIFLLIGLFYSLTVLSAAVPFNKVKIESLLKKVESNYGLADQQEIIQTLKASIDWLNDADVFEKEAKQYQNMINNFRNLTRNLQQQIEKKKMSNLFLYRLT